MKSEAWIFIATTIFLVLVTPTYWFVTAGSEWEGDWTGTSALTMCTLLTGMVSAYLYVHANRMDERPEDRADSDIADGAGELGFFPPYSWWPLWVAMTASAIVYAVAVGAWWLLIIGVVLGFIALCGWIFEYYRGQFSH